ncbi:MAG: hypothetical protein KGI27_15310, partial [Thaumarchaeota archaeon]|nr:hypothetical protein [Nitrososphaerota archaeon]
MKIFQLPMLTAGIITALIVLFFSFDTTYAENTDISLPDQYPPFNVNYSSNPVIITAVELATPLQQGNQSGTDCTVYP